MKRILCAAAVVALICGTTAWAHHSYAAFDTARLIEVEGILDALEWVSPHTVFTVKSDEGRMIRGEWRAPIAMQRIDFTRDTLHAGDRIVLVGNPRRDFDESGIVNLKGIRRLSDGSAWGVTQASVDPLGSKR